MEKFEKVMFVIIVGIVLIVSIAFSCDLMGRIDSEQELDISIDSDDIRYISGGFCKHSKMIITTNDSIIILDNHYNIGLGNITITIRDSSHNNEYKLIDWKYTEKTKDVIE